MLPNCKHLKFNVRNRFQSALTFKSFPMRMPFYVLVVSCLSFAGCGLFSNNDIETFKVTPISAVEVALEISADSGDKISIERDGNEIFSFRMSHKDTVVYDAGLAPNTSYIWKAINKSSRRDKNKERQATTLTTTSSNFTWQTFSFGEHSSSTLYGVSIIDENNIWAVGEIFMNDSTGQTDDDRYNAIHWNGIEWTLKRITVQFRQNMITPIMNGVFAFSAENIWLSSGVPVFGDGTNWTQYHLFDMGILDDTDGGIESIWGNNSENMFFGGALGSLAHYDGQAWQKIETGTELNIEDVHGNEEQGVVVVASKLFESSDNAIIKINENNSVDFLSNEGIPGAIEGIWFDKSGVSYIVGGGMFRKSSLVASENWWSFRQGISDNYMFSIDANWLNDIMVSGDTGELLHFNGAGWTSYKNEFRGYLYAVDIYDNIAVAVGFDGGKAIITMGVRENE